MVMEDRESTETSSKTRTSAVEDISAPKALCSHPFIRGHLPDQARGQECGESGP